MARTWGKRPSELLALDDSWEAWELDEAVLLGGDHIEGLIARAEADAIRGKRDPGAAVQRALEDALGIRRAPASAAARGRRYRYDLSGGVPRVTLETGG